MVLAISSLLAIILIGGYQEVQQRERFRDALERTVTLLEQVKNEANTTVNVEGSGDDEGDIVFAKAVIFTDASSQVTVVTLRAADNDNLSNLVEFNDRTLEIPWQVRFNGGASSHRSVVFTRNPTNGRLNTFVLSGTDVDNASNYVNQTGSGSNTNATASLVLVDDNTGFRGTVRVNAATNDIERSYDN